MTIRFDCPHCGERLTARDRQAGAALCCPGCGRATLVPDDWPVDETPAPGRRRTLWQQGEALRQSNPLLLVLLGGGVAALLFTCCGGLLLLGVSGGGGQPSGPGVVPHGGQPAVGGFAAVAGGLRLEGTYRRRYDDAGLGVGKNDFITFSPDGRFQERGFLHAALGGRVINGTHVFYNPDAGGQGTFRVGGSTLELSYAGGESVRLSCRPLGVSADTVFLNGHAFVR